MKGRPPSASEHARNTAHVLLAEVHELQQALLTLAGLVAGRPIRPADDDPVLNVHVSGQDLSASILVVDR